MSTPGGLSKPPSPLITGHRHATRQDLPSIKKQKKTKKVLEMLQHALVHACVHHYEVMAAVVGLQLLDPGPQTLNRLAYLFRTFRVLLSVNINWYTSVLPLEWLTPLSRAHTSMSPLQPEILSCDWVMSTPNLLPETLMTSQTYYQWTLKIAVWSQPWLMYEAVFVARWTTTTTSRLIRQLWHKLMKASIVVLVTLAIWVGRIVKSRGPLMLTHL